MATYVAQLRQLTQYCEFGDSLEEMLRDRLVCGIAVVLMQWAILAEPQLTFTKALQMIQTMETARRVRVIYTIRGMPRHDTAWYYTRRGYCFYIHRSPAEIDRNQLLGVWLHR